jgi:NADPH:quinone reductase-like Zn-dependent oxidoreductase
MHAIKRGLLASVGIAVVTASTLIATPAQAGGDGTVYIYGSTSAVCTANLNKSISLYRQNGYQVTGVHACRKTGDGRRYFGDFVAN